MTSKITSLWWSACIVVKVLLRDKVSLQPHKVPDSMEGKWELWKWKLNNDVGKWGNSRACEDSCHSSAQSVKEYVPQHRGLIREVSSCRNLTPTLSAIQCSDWFYCFFSLLPAYWDKEESLTTAAADWLFRVSRNVIYKLSSMKQGTEAVIEGMKVPLEGR